MICFATKTAFKHHQILMQFLSLEILMRSTVNVLNLTSGNLYILKKARNGIRRGLEKNGLEKNGNLLFWYPSERL